MSILETRDLCKSFGPTDIIRNLSLSVNAGERHAIIGPNGAGKSTLFNLISGLHVPTSGDIVLDGASIAGLKPHQINRRGLSRSFQVANVFPNMTVRENIRCAVLYSLGYGYGFWRDVGRLTRVSDKTDQIIDLVGLASKSAQQAAILSHADQRILELAITIAGGAAVILLDEPTAGMSRAETEQTIALIRRATEGRTLLIVEHDMSVVFTLSDRISVLVHGEIIASGSPEEIRQNAAVQAAYLGDLDQEQTRGSNA